MNKHMILFTLAITALSTQPLCAMLALRRTAKIQRPVSVQKRLMTAKIHPSQYKPNRLFPSRNIYSHNHTNYLNQLQPNSTLLQACEENKSEEWSLAISDLKHFLHDVTTLGIWMTIRDAYFIKRTIENLLPHLSAEEKKAEFSLFESLYNKLHEECPLSYNEKDTNNMLRHPAMKP